MGSPIRVVAYGSGKLNIPLYGYHDSKDCPIRRLPLQKHPVDYKCSMSILNVLRPDVHRTVEETARS